MSLALFALTMLGRFVCFILSFCVSCIVYITKGYFLIPEGQVVRAAVFGCIAGTAITLGTIVFNLIDKFNSRKKTPLDPK
ncbi:hypothetical protein KER63_26000 [Escherichia coli]|nr:hypothetical protein [Escherichia coli]